MTIKKRPEFETLYNLPALEEERILPTHCNKCGKAFKQKGQEICPCKVKVKLKKGEKF